MILQALHDYYERRASGRQPLAPIGFELKEIPFVLELAADGRLLQLRDLREKQDKKLAAPPRQVPRGVKRTVGIAANFLWDKADYVLGLVPGKGNPERVAEQHAAFRARIEALPAALQADAGIAAVRRFYAGHLPEVQARYPAEWQEWTQSNPLLTFQLQGDADWVCQRPAVRAAWATLDADTAADGLCLITGEPAHIAETHPAIKGVWGAQTSGANIVSFNLDAFRSYGKKQGHNAPIGEVAAERYVTALNEGLLARGSRRRLQIGDASAVFWASRDGEVLEDNFADLLGEPSGDGDDPHRDTEQLRALYESLKTGAYQPAHAGTRFHVLGLAPNAARISIRFWLSATLDVLGARLGQHFCDLDIVHGERQPARLSLFRLLLCTAAQGKAENIPPNLGGELTRAVLEGRPYPATLLQAALRRIRAERLVDYPRAALIKAVLVRAARAQHSQRQEVSVSLDPANTNVGYRLGRLFAVLERIQEEASPGLNATIRDRYFGAASSTPLTVFPLLNRLKNHHLGKLDNPGRARNLEALVGEIVDGLDAAQPFPPHLSLADQGRFAVGYYHQRQHASTYRSARQGESA
ncbi:type I-C CRISPR-associated protein Cas8c/Csd1 [Plasticicumulans acidivorans]|uniref:CRISPR-associated Csd1 family protein n=1 Tax=Plasticicumulans acidivorans TaxID=886464 RepID=A0A317MVT1_9GAMM|nr:type I-C CRISPR-associated protein Cas8c/Csd1 [Plasticicumulans acidivorans]PWV62415.1 CRISPR-associated Csd1 family protein [Plasticicumulans acidivorans]